MSNTIVVVDPPDGNQVVVVQDETIVIVESPDVPTIIDSGYASAPPAVDPDFFLQTQRRLSEFDTPEKKIDARINLELQVIDLGTFN